MSQQSFHSCRADLRLDLLLGAAGSLLLAIVLVLSHELGTDAGESLTRNTVRVSLAWYALALLAMLRLEPDDWKAATVRGRIARWFWTWGAVCFLVHVTMAFHYYHHWSHHDAFERTRQLSGVGEGIYASYLFTGIWIMDVVGWWVRPASDAGRPHWIDRCVHSFMLFITFNGMVVFETGVIRWAGWLMFAVIGSAGLLARRASGSGAFKSVS